MNVIIAIGFDNSPNPTVFRDQVELVIDRLGTMLASIEGESWSPEWGVEGAAWFAAEFPDFDTYAEARARILAIGAAHRQDAIAFTFGTTDVADCPKGRKPAYRDLL